MICPHCRSVDSMVCASYTGYLICNECLLRFKAGDVYD